MFGHVAGRPRRWPWVVLSFLFAMAFASSFAVMEVTTEVQIDDDVLSIIRIGTAVGLGLSLLLLLFSSRRRRRANAEEKRRAAGNDGMEGRSPSEKHAQTYEEVFGVQQDLDEEGLPRAPEGEESLSEKWQNAEEMEEMMVEGDEPADVPAPPSEEDLQPLQADVDGPADDAAESVDQVESEDADVDSDEHLRKIREEFKARVEEAALRVKQREGDPHEAASAPNPER
jgi:hypothetical protein